MENEDETPEKYAGRRVAELRADRGLTQAEVASRLTALGHEMHQTTVAKLESGRRPIRLDELVALAKILQAPLSSLIPADSGPSPLEQAGLEASQMRRNVETMEFRVEAATAALNEHKRNLASATREWKKSLDRYEAELAKVKRPRRG